MIQKFEFYLLLNIRNCIFLVLHISEQFTSFVFQFCIFLGLFSFSRDLVLKLFFSHLQHIQILQLFKQNYSYLLEKQRGIKQFMQRVLYFVLVSVPNNIGPVPYFVLILVPKRSSALQNWIEFSFRKMLSESGWVLVLGHFSSSLLVSSFFCYKFDHGIGWTSFGSLNIEYFSDPWWILWGQFEAFQFYLEM